MLILGSATRLSCGRSAGGFARCASSTTNTNIEKPSARKFDDLALVPPPRPSGAQASYKRGTGGRSSFSGIVATVFGATGTLGPYIVNRLGKEGSQVIVPYRGDAYSVKDLKLAGDLGQILFFPYSLKDDESIQRALKHSNVVINLMGARFETRNFSFDDVNVEAARRIARFAREAGVKKLIHFSSMNAAVTPELHLIPGGSQFLKTKALGEIAVREEFPDAIIIRPATMFGHADRFINYILSNWFHYNQHKVDLYKRGDETYKMPIHATDVARGVMAALHDPTAAGKTFEFVGPYCYNLGNLVDWMYNKTNRGRDFTYYNRYNLGPWTVFKTNWNSAVNYIMSLNSMFNWEWIETTTAVSDVLTGVPTLADLGIVDDLCVLEVKSADHLTFYNRISYYYSKMGEFPEPPKPIHYPPLRRPGVQMGHQVETETRYGRFATEGGIGYISDQLK